MNVFKAVLALHQRCWLFKRMASGCVCPRLPFSLWEWCQVLFTKTSLSNYKRFHKILLVSLIDVIWPRIFYRSLLCRGAWKKVQWSAFIIQCNLSQYYKEHCDNSGNKLNQILESQQTPHISPSRASYRVSIMRILEKIDYVITALHCMSNIVWSAECLLMARQALRLGYLQAQWWYTCAIPTSIRNLNCNQLETPWVVIRYLSVVWLMMWLIQWEEKLPSI